MAFGITGKNSATVAYPAAPADVHQPTASAVSRSRGLAFAGALSRCSLPPAGLKRPAAWDRAGSAGVPRVWVPVAPSLQVPSATPLAVVRV